MKRTSKKRFWLFLLLFSFTWTVTTSQPSVAGAAEVVKGDKEDRLGKPHAAFDVNKMSDMSDYDPANPVIPMGIRSRSPWWPRFPVRGQSTASFIGSWFNGPPTISTSGAAFSSIGKKKLVQVLKADHMGKPDQCKKVCERMILQEKVHALWGTDGSHLMKIINEVANKYKVIALNASCGSDDIQDATNFGRYSFMTSFSTIQQGRGLAYFYGQIRKKEKKFYILNQATPWAISSGSPSGTA